MKILKSEFSKEVIVKIIFSAFIVIFLLLWMFCAKAQKIEPRLDTLNVKDFVLNNTYIFSKISTEKKHIGVSSLFNDGIDYYSYNEILISFFTVKIEAARFMSSGGNAKLEFDLSKNFVIVEYSYEYVFNRDSSVVSKFSYSYYPDGKETWLFYYEYETPREMNYEEIIEFKGYIYNFFYNASI